MYHQQNFLKEINAKERFSGWGEIIPEENIELKEWRKNKKNDEYLDKEYFFLLKFFKVYMTVERQN